MTPPEVLVTSHHLDLSPSDVNGASIHEYRRDSRDPWDSFAPQSDAIMVVMNMRPMEVRRSWLNGKETLKYSHEADDFGIWNFRHQHILESSDPFNTINLVLPEPCFSKINKNHRSSRINIAPRIFQKDVVMENLFKSILPTLRGLQGYDRFFLDCILQALIIHISHYYGKIDVNFDYLRGSLSVNQEKIVKDLMLSRISGNISMKELAAAIDISPDNFSRLFKRTTGVPPYRWLSLERIERAKSLLRNSNYSLVEIALICGFADQSHFTRTFSRAASLSPGEWRRQSRI